MKPLNIARYISVAITHKFHQKRDEGMRRNEDNVTAYHQRQNPALLDSSQCEQLLRGTSNFHQATFSTITELGIFKKNIQGLFSLEVENSFVLSLL